MMQGQPKYVCLAKSVDEALAIARKIDKAFRAGFVAKKKEGNIC